MGLWAAFGLVLGKDCEHVSMNRVPFVGVRCGSDGFGRGVSAGWDHWDDDVW